MICILTVPPEMLTSKFPSSEKCKFAEFGYSSCPFISPLEIAGIFIVGLPLTTNTLTSLIQVLAGIGISIFVLASVVDKINVGFEP